MFDDRFNVIVRDLNATWAQDDSRRPGMAASTIWASARQNIEDILKVVCHGHAVSTSERDDRAFAITEWILNECLDVKAVDAARITRLSVLEHHERHAAPTSRDSVAEFDHETLARVRFAAGGYSGGE
jgi:hypothetical protein